MISNERIWGNSEWLTERSQASRSANRNFSAAESSVQRISFPVDRDEMTCSMSMLRVNKYRVYKWIRMQKISKPFRKECHILLLSSSRRLKQEEESVWKNYLLLKHPYPLPVPLLDFCDDEANSIWTTSPSTLRLFPLAPDTGNMAAKQEL